MSHFYLQQPKLRDGSVILEIEDHLKLVYRKEEFLIYPDENVSLDQMRGFLQQVTGEFTVKELIQQQKDFFSAEQVVEFLNVLDENWMLAEGKRPTFSGKSGMEFIMELEDLSRDWDHEFGETELTRLIQDGQASKNLLVGWTLEYYHVTKRAHDCISPAIAKAHGRFREMAVEFFLEEYRHDKLLLKSLQAMGYTEQDITDSIPLPYTAAISNLLAKWAHTDLLSFMASLFLFEGTVQDGNDYMNSLEGYDLPEEFVYHQGLHNNINAEGDHGNVTRDFFAQIDYISPEDQKRVIQNMRLLAETYLRQNQNAVSYYNQPDVVIPRLLSKLK